MVAFRKAVGLSRLLSVRKVSVLSPAATVTLSFVVLALAGCTNPTSEGTFTLGVILPLTGGLAPAGRIMAEAVARAAQQANATGGVAGLPLVLDVRDGAGDPAKAAREAEALRDAKVKAVIGAVTSGVSKAVLGVLGPADIPLLSPGATSPEFTDQMNRTAPADRWFFRTAPSDTLRGKVASQYMVAQGWDRVLVLYDNNPYGNGLRGIFEQAYAGAGRNVTSAAFEEARADYSEVLGRALAPCTMNGTCPQALFFIGYPDEGLRVAQAWWARPEWRSIAWVLADSEQGFFDRLRAAGLDLTGFEGVQPVGEGPGFEAYQQLAGGQAPPFSGNAYDAVLLLALAGEKARGQGGAPLRDALRDVATAPGDVVGPADYARATVLLRGGTDIDYEGASGGADFDANGDVTSAYEVFRLDNAGKMARKCLIPEDAVVQAVVQIPAACTSPAASP